MALPRLSKHKRRNPHRISVYVRRSALARVPARRQRRPHLRQGVQAGAHLPAPVHAAVPPRAVPALPGYRQQVSTTYRHFLTTADDNKLYTNVHRVYPQSSSLIQK